MDGSMHVTAPLAEPTTTVTLNTEEGMGGTVTNVQGGGDGDYVIPIDGTMAHPSPMVAAAAAAAMGGRGGYPMSYYPGGRGRGRGRGRGAFAGRGRGRGRGITPEVETMIASKTWVRPRTMDEGLTVKR